MSKLTLSNRRALLVLLTLLLLFTAAWRILHLVDFVEWPDEIYTVWQAQTNIHDGFAHTDPFWPPLFGILVWGWMAIAGPTLEVHRFVSVLFALLTVSCAYRAALELNRLAGRKGSQPQAAALLSALVLAAMAYSIFAGVDVRGYSLALMALALAFWFTLRWLGRPDLRGGALVSITIALLLSATFSSLIFIPYLTLFVVVMRPRLFVRWVGIGVGVLVLILPIVPQFIENNVMGRLSAMHVPLPPFGEALAAIFRDFGGSYWFLAPLVLAGVLVVVQAIRFAPERRPIVFLVAWVLLFPAIIYFAVSDRNFWHPRYLWWVMPGIALLIGYGLARLPRAAVGVAAVFFVALPAIPTDFFAYRLAETTSPPFRMVFSWLAKELRPGDVIVIDPKCTCGKPTAWDLFVPQYFATGYLPIVSRPGSASRVWYLSTTGWPRDEVLVAEVEKGRKASIFVGPWYFLLRLYEGPPSWAGAGFGGKIRLNGVEVQKASKIVAENESVQVKLWWSAQAALTRDYSVSLAVLDQSGRVIAQADGPPRADGTPEQTSQWQVGTYYEDLRQIHMPAGIDPGRYDLVVTVYQWWDGVRLTPEANSLWATVGADQSYLRVDTLQVPGPL
jgi:hypothetical protein